MSKFFYRSTIFSLVVFAVDVFADYAYVINYGENTVSVVEMSDNTVVHTISVGESPFGAAIAPDKDFVYVANIVSNNISVIDTQTQTVVDSIAVGNVPLEVMASPSFVLKDFYDIDRMRIIYDTKRAQTIQSFNQSLF